jgi:hypothetical protein
LCVSCYQYEDRLYAVSHGLANGGSRVVVFDVVPTSKSRTHHGHEGETGKHDGSAPLLQSCPIAALVYRRSITSPDLFLNLGPNDVIEGRGRGSSSSSGDGSDGSDGGGGGGEIYVTQWLKYAAPLAGKTHAHSLVEYFTEVLQELVMFDIPHRFESLRLITLTFLSSAGLLPPSTFHPAGSSVVRCVWDSDNDDGSGDEGGGDEARCEVAVGGFVMANGITTDPERKTVFVNDIGRQAVLVFNRDPVSD